MPPALRARMRLSRSVPVREDDRVARPAAKSVLAIELDTELYERLKTELSGYFNLEIINMDVLQYPFAQQEPFKVVANIPYYITTPIIFHLLESRSKLQSMTLTIQKEVAERIRRAGPAEKSTAYCRSRCSITQIRRYSSLFQKKPSALCRRLTRPLSGWISAKKPPVQVKDEKMLFRIIRAAFSQRRKTLSNSLKPLIPDCKELLVKADIDPSVALRL